MSDADRIARLEEIIRGAYAAMNSIAATLAGSSRDHSLDRRDSWIYHIACGWTQDDPDDLYAAEDLAAFREIKRRHGFISESAWARCDRYRRAVVELEREARAVGYEPHTFDQGD